MPNFIWTPPQHNTVLGVNRSRVSQPSDHSSRRGTVILPFAERRVRNAVLSVNLGRRPPRFLLAQDRNHLTNIMLAMPQLRSLTVAFLECASGTNSDRTSRRATLL